MGDNWLLHLWYLLYLLRHRFKFPLKKSHEFLRISDSGFVHVVFEGTLGLILLNKDPLKTRKSNGDFNVLLILHHGHDFHILSNYSLNAYLFDYSYISKGQLKSK